ncbi:MAG: hypothetical protein LAT67_04560 [Balneolales bacterium]|nr:hypothetical protein [Balneolales bacterium]
MVSVSKLILLIVESEIIARRIRRFNLPGIEVLATAGYAWKPKIDLPRLKIQAKADPEAVAVAFRKKLKELAPFAHHIIICTDSDPSGRFISHCIVKFLGNYANKACFGHLTYLSANSIQSVIERAILQKPDSSENATAIPLLSGAVISDQISRKIKRATSRVGRLNPASQRDIFIRFAAWLAYLETIQRTPYFASKCGRYILGPTQEIKSPIKFEQYYTIEPVKNITQNFWRPVVLPASTAFIPCISGNSFSETQLSLNKLFAYDDPDFPDGLISYPRTSSQFYSETTWRNLQSDLLISHQNISQYELLPLQLQKNHHKRGHQALHIFSFSNTPEDIGYRFEKNQQIIYKYIYHKTLVSLLLPQVTPTSKLAYCNELQTNLYFVDKSEIPENYTMGKLYLKPRVVLEDYMQNILKSGMVKPSSLGKSMDYLIQQGLIKVWRNETTGFDFAEYYDDLFQNDESEIHRKMSPAMLFQKMYSLFEDEIHRIDTVEELKKLRSSVDSLFNA